MQSITRKALTRLHVTLAIERTQFEALHRKDWDTWKRCESKLFQRRWENAQASK